VEIFVHFPRKLVWFICRESAGAKSYDAAPSGRQTTMAGPQTELQNWALHQCAVIDASRSSGTIAMVNPA
jgi:hypothetical protein